MFNLCMSLCLTSSLVCVCLSCRPTGGHVGRARQLQHHSERAEAFLQQAARGAGPVGESESCHGDLSWLSGTSMRNVLATFQLLPSHRPMLMSHRQNKSYETRLLLCSGLGSRVAIHY